MKIEVSQEFLQIILKIKAEAKPIDEWVGEESDDLFQSEHFCGGYDADEMAFCFSYFDDNNTEYWFQFTIDDVQKFLDGKLKEIIIRKPE